MPGSRPHEQATLCALGWRAAICLDPASNQFVAREVAECGDLVLDIVFHQGRGRHLPLATIVDAVVADTVLAGLTDKVQCKPLFHHP